MFYLVKTPWWLKKLYPDCVWDMAGSGKKLYLSFDDGPHPVATPFVLDTLHQYGAKASFFCIGKNVKAYPDVYQRILAEGHSAGNHSFNHLNGWKTETPIYLDDVAAAKEFIGGNLFRPPYGRITRAQLAGLSSSRLGLKAIMWTVLSGDFDTEINGEACLQHVIKNTEEGSIIVFHDSEKAMERMAYALPKVLQYFDERGYIFEAITTDML